ncbi:MAG: leucine-rich repeat domain-containing protein [Prevotella sp.]|nr:leucine-rich repeat domain-containing protein [Prevotella sp.]
MKQTKQFMQHMLLVLVGLVSAISVKAANYDFKAENSDGVTIYYKVNGNEATVVAGDVKYSGTVNIPETVSNEGTTYPVTAIGNDAFWNCQNLKAVEMTSNISSIGRGAFSNNSLLETVTFKEGLKSIGSNAFYGCNSLSSISIPRSVESIGDGAFAANSLLTSIVVDSENTIYDSRNDCNGIIESSTNTLIAGCKTTVIPDGILAIGKSVFSQCHGMKTIEIPSSVTSIGEKAFFWHFDLEYITIPSSVSAISSEAFAYCDKLSSISLPTGLKTIGQNAFHYCKKLGEIEIPETVEVIEKGVFSGCTILASITSRILIPFEINESVFDGISEQAVLYVPKGTSELYKNTDGWNIPNIVEIDNNNLHITLTADIQTFCSDKDLDFTGVEGLKAYIANGFSPSTGEVVMSSVTQVPAKTGLLLVGTAGQEYEVPFMETDFIYSNLLRGLLEDVEVTNGYVLNGNEFVAVDEAVTVKGGEAYLNVEPVASASRLAISFTDATGLSDAAGIDTVILDNAATSGTWYTLQGVRLEGKPSKQGIYLHQGRKVVVK